MSNSNDGAFAFGMANDMGDLHQVGLTKREYMAAQVLQGILANDRYDSPRSHSIEGMAVDAVTAADALLAELEKDNG